MKRHRKIPRVAAIVPLVLALLVAGGCAGDGEDFEVTVQDSRDRVDDALAQVTDATSFEDLLRRLRAGASEVRGASDELAEEDAPDELETEATALAGAYRALSNEMIATASGLEDVTTEDTTIQGLEFQNWNRVQDALAAMRREGVDVAPLNRYGTPG